MVSRWEDEFPSETAVRLTSPQPEDIAISMAYKAFLLIAVIAMISGVWALTSGPASTPEVSDATLGPPMGANVGLARSNPQAR